MNELIEIWNNYIFARQQLMDNQIIRTFNNPIEDFSEWLVANCLNGHLAINVNQRDYDVQTEDKYIQVKSIAKAPHNNNGYIVTQNDRENALATHYAFVFFDNYIPTAIYIVNVDYVRDFPRSQIKRVNLIEVCVEINLIAEISVNEQQQENGI
jgi:hypothetical protein